MMMKREKNNVNSYSVVIFWLILAVAVFTRLWNLENLPLGINQDEAFAGYEAFNLLNTGKDSWLYRFPIYLTVWGSGSSAVYSYLIIPFMALLGTDIWVIRLPQALLGILSCYLFYRLLSKIYGKRGGLIGFFIITICPWHIMLSRWGLDCNVVVFFLLAGFYFFVRGVKEIRYLYVSALFYGLGLYAYAVCVPFIVIVFVGQMLYLVWYRHCWRDLGAIVGAGALFILMAIPIVWLGLINQGIVTEVKTDYFSIPKLVYWRSGEIGFQDFSLKLSALRRIFIFGDDGLVTNRIMPFGMFYPFSILLIGIGLWFLIRRAAEEKTRQQLMISACIFGQIIVGLCYAVLLYPCINRLNFLWVNFLIALVLFISALPRKIFMVVLGMYGIGFILFIYAYIVHYNQTAAENFTPDLKEALTEAERWHQRTGLPIVILEQPAVFPKVLYYTKMSNEALQQEVQWWNYPASYLEARTFGHYAFYPQWDYVRIPTEAIYIAPVARRYYFYQFRVHPVGAMMVAVP